MYNLSLIGLIAEFYSDKYYFSYITVFREYTVSLATIRIKD